MKKLLRIADVREIIRLYNLEEITFSRMVEMLNERANKALSIFGVSECVAYCGDCGKRLTLVRPGKHQCDNPNCESNVR